MKTETHNPAVASTATQPHKDAGGPAFPVPPDICIDPVHGHMSGARQGQTLRDYYKAKIMQGFCSNPAIFAPNAMCGWSLVNCTDEQLITYAGILANKMIEEGKVNNE